MGHTQILAPSLLEIWELELIRWSPEYGSVGYALTQIVQLKISSLLCTANN
jgi:hypothetical protein